MVTIQQVAPFSTFKKSHHTETQTSETAVPYTAFKKAGFEIDFATENGTVPECDQKMLRGVTQKLLVCSYRPGCARSI